MSSTPILVSAVLTKAGYIFNDIPAAAQIELFNEAHASVCRHVKIYEDDQIPVPIVASAQKATFDPDVLRVWSAYYWQGAGSFLQMEEMSEDELDYKHKGWRGSPSGPPFYWYQQGNKIGFYPTPNDSTDTFSISGASNATPIVITSAAHGLLTTDDGTPANAVSISGVTGNLAANGSFYAKRTGYSTTTFALYQDPDLTIPVAGNGVYVSGGTLTTGANYPYVRLYAQKRRVLATTDYLPGMIYEPMAWVTEIARLWAELRHRDRLQEMTASAHMALNKLSWQIMGRPVRLKPSVNFATPQLRH